MAMKLLPESEGYAVVAGSIQQLSEELYKEYQLSGYSILLDDIVKAFLDEAKYYAGWAVLDCQTKATTSIELNETIVLSGDEYVIIQPLVKLTVIFCKLDWLKLLVGSESKVMGYLYQKLNRTIMKRKTLCLNLRFVWPQ